MDCKVTGSLMHYAVCLIFLGVQSNPVFPAPASSPSVICADIDNIVGIAGIIKLEAEKLQSSYLKYYEDMTASVPPEVPNLQISGDNKLQGVCIKNKLFQLHIAHAKNYHKELLLDSNDISKAFGEFQDRLSSLTNMTQKSIGAKNCTLTEEVNLSHKTMYRKEVYVHGLTDTLKDWSAEVLKVIEEEQKRCGQK